MELEQFIYRILIAAGAGMLIGFERQLHQKSAGLRTNTLVSLGAAVYVLISLTLLEGKEFGDLSRVTGQIVTGIGFLGAGVIIHQGVNIQGLTTAATIWCSAAVGCLSGAGMFIEAAITTGLIIFVNFILLKIDIIVARIGKKEAEE